MHDDMPDPVAHAINCMLDHMHAMDERLESMCKTMKCLGAELAEMELPNLASCEIASAAHDTERREGDEEQGRDDSLDAIKVD